MIQRILSAVLFVLAIGAAHAAAPALEMASRPSDSPAAAPERFLAPQVAPEKVVSLAAPKLKQAPVMDVQGRLRIANERPVAPVASRDWAFIDEGMVNRLSATSDSAQGVRLKLDVSGLTAPVEVRVQGTGGRVEVMRVEPGRSSEAWTPWTEGPTQVVELLSPHGAPVPVVPVTGVAHFDESPFVKAAASCTVPVACTTSDSLVDSAIAERKNSSTRITFMENGGGFVCSATLLNTERFPAAYLLTANHCVASVAVANSVTAFWFYEGMSCSDPTPQAGFVQQTGTQLVFTNHNADSTLLLANSPAPAGAVYSGWSGLPVPDGESVVSISHPRGDTTRIATGTMSGELRIIDRAQDEYGVTFTRGIIEGGSSGSGLYTLSGGALQLRGVLTGTTIRNGSGMSCTNLNEQALYGRMEIFAPQMSQYLRAGGPTADDTPNRVQDWTGIGPEASLNNRSVSFDRRIEYVGDVDVFRFRLDAPASVTLNTTGVFDTVGTLMDSTGKSIEANDDTTFGNINFGITRNLEPGTYHVMVASWDPNAVGSYRLVMTAQNTSTGGNANFTDLWWNASEAGWGINLAHQGDIVFATLYTYDTNGSPMWLYMSNGDKQADGSYQGSLYRATGPSFNASPWGAYNATVVGTMRLAFATPNSGSLTYSVNGVTVVKSITRYQFSSTTTCTPTTASRVGSTNYQDLWWNPAESGWGVNLAHQGNILFATLYTYDTNGQAMWLSMSNGVLTGVRTYSGALHRSTGPAFNANPWGSYSLQPVGTMTFTFSDGNNGTLTYSVNGVQVTKPIQRFVFASPVPACSSL